MVEKKVPTLRARGVGRCCARVGANALDHRTESVRALRGEMLAQAQALEHGDRVGRKNVAGPLAGEHREQDGDQAAHDMGIAVAGEGEYGTALAIRMHGGCEPDLARAALHLVCADALALGEGAQGAAKLDDIAIAVANYS
jgi:hypothetical protein